MNDKYQIKSTREEIEAILNWYYRGTNANGLNEDLAERINYYQKRLLKIQKGEPEIETENTENTAPKGWQ